MIESKSGDNENDNVVGEKAATSFQQTIETFSS